MQCLTTDDLWKIFVDSAHPIAYSAYMNKYMTYEDRLDRLAEYSGEEPTAKDRKWMRRHASMLTRKEDREVRQYERRMRGK